MELRVFCDFYVANICTEGDSSLLGIPTVQFSVEQRSRKQREEFNVLSH